jgi:hypothetical protein
MEESREIRVMRGLQWVESSNLPLKLTALGLIRRKTLFFKRLPRLKASPEGPQQPVLVQIADYPVPLKKGSG